MQLTHAVSSRTHLHGDSDTVDSADRLECINAIMQPAATSQPACAPFADIAIALRRPPPSPAHRPAPPPPPTPFLLHYVSLKSMSTFRSSSSLLRPFLRPSTSTSLNDESVPLIEKSGVAEKGAEAWRVFIWWMLIPFPAM